MVIKSLTNEKVKKYLKLQDRKYRHKTKTFIVEGKHLVIEAYKQNIIKELILEENETFLLNNDVVYVTKDIIKKISTLETPSTIMALCTMKEEEEIGNKILILDQIQDPGNLGTIIRSACAFNIDTIILGNNTVDVYNPKVIRATQGMMFHTNIIEKDLLKVIPTLKEKGITIYGTDVVDGEETTNIELSDKYALVMGNEGSGVSDQINELCDRNLYIKTNKYTESLNVAIAASILLYEFNRGN